MQIHDQQVKSIARRRPAGGDRYDGFLAQHIVNDRWPGINKLIETLAITFVERGRRVRTASDQHQGSEHRRHRIIENGDQPLGARDMVIAMPSAQAVGHAAVKARITKPTGLTF